MLIIPTPLGLLAYLSKSAIHLSDPYICIIQTDSHKLNKILKREVVYMDTLRCCMLLLLVALLVSSAEARPLSLLQSKHTEDSNVDVVDTRARAGYSNVFGTLGMVCRCCDDKGRDCKTKWLQPCPNLQCHPWKKQPQ